MIILVIDVLIVGMNRLELNGLDTATVGDADHRPWEVVRQMPVYPMALLMDTTSIITFQRPGRIKGRLGSRYRRCVTKTVS